jgi:hypothetical protein
MSISKKTTAAGIVVGMVVGSVAVGIAVFLPWFLFLLLVRSLDVHHTHRKCGRRSVQRMT